MMLFFITALISLRPTFTIRRWLKTLNATGALPAEAAIKSARQWIMVQAHIIPVIAVVAVYWARGM